MRAVRVAFLLIFFAAPAAALEPVRVAEGVWAFVGDLGQRSPENLGNNATFGAIETADGVVLVDSGGSRRGAEALAAAVASVIPKPVIAVVNTGGQDHRWLGNGFFRDKGARIVASADAVADHRERFDGQYAALEVLIGEEGVADTEAVFAAETFDDHTGLEIGGLRLELIKVGPAHTPGDTLVWLPDRRIAFSGDVVYVERLLGLIAVSSLGGWIEAFGELEALDPAMVVPGHGHPVPLDEARAQTLAYLTTLDAAVRTVIEAGGSEAEATAVDQSAFAHLANFATLSRRNALQAFVELEFE